MRDFIKKVSILFIILFLSVPLALMGQLLGSAAANEGGSTIEVGGNTKITQNGCSRKIEKTEKISWRLPRKPVDLVILQDASGSFKNTIPNVQNALKTLTTFVKEEEYDENNPRLVKTDNPDTSDRVMMATFQGADGYNYYYNNDFTGRKDVYGSWGPDYDYKYKASNLSSDQNDIHQFINNIKVAGGTPTVPAIDDVIAQYNERKGNMANGRKTIFLLITDGVANGKRDPDGKVRLEYSDYRNNILTRAWNFNELTEASQNVLGRVKEVKEASTRLKNVVGSEGTVVVGFWEDVTIFANSKAQYYDTYKEGYSKYFDIGDNRSVQEIFHEALEGMASPAKNINGKDVSFYVNEQSDINKFSSRVLESVGAALVKEDIKGEFEVTPGYKVDAVRINGKKIVSKVTDSKKEIRGKIVQEGDKVTISVPESVFNPGNNKFDYDLSKEAHAEQVDEDDEQDPPADYKPVKETVPVPELTGKFKVGDFATETIGGSKETVEVQKLEYCYPSATKKIADQDQSNDTGTIEDPLQLTKKPSYAANLSAKDETFTYTVDYNFNNAPYEFKKNVMLTDPLDYRLEVVGHHASGPEGTILTRVVKQKDDLGNDREVVVADVPSVNGYEYLVLQKAKMTITVRLKEQYRNNQASKEFMALLQDNDGFGLLNQGNIMWNGEDNNPDPSNHAKTADKPSTIRRSNPVYVKPPVETEVTKKVNDKEHEDLKKEEELFEYKVTVPWPGLADTFSLTDTVVSELEVQADSLNVKLGEKDNTELKTATKVEGQTVSLTLDKTQLEKISRKVTRRKTKDVQYLELTFKAKIRPGADLSKYKKDGQVKVPNTADVALNDIKKTSNEVTVTPPKPKEPTIDKKINENLDSFQTFDGQPYNYNITTAVPSDVANYKKFVIRDTLDANLELAGDVSIKGSAAALFDIHTNGQEITATVKDGQFGELAKYSTVELVIPAKVKNDVTGTTIENKASISFTNENNVEKEVESKPVTVTPPPVTKKINETLDHLDIATGQAYNYNIKTKLPTDITDYKKFVITDTLEGDLSVINETSSKPVIKGAAAAFFDVTVEGQTVTATMKDFANATALAGQEVELIIPAKINDGVSRINIPNTAKFSFTDKNDHSGEKETKPVTVTPPSEPGVDKKINETLTEATIGAETDFTYNIKAKLPNDITTYKSFVVTDTLDENLTPGQAEIKGAAAKFFDVTVQGQTVTATMKDFANAGDYGNQEVELVIHAKVKKGSTVPSIENKAKITYTNKNDQQGEKETKPVTVTPPPITKKVNGQEHADLGKLSEIFTYTIDSTVPHVADTFTISDDIVKELAFEGEATVTVDGQAVQDLTVTTEGQRLTVTFGKEQVKQYAGKAVQVSFKAKVKEGITFDALLATYPNESKDKPVVPNTASYIINDNPDSKKESKPVTVTPPPTTTPELKKEVNGAERYDLAKRNEEFTYTLKTTMPASATVFEMTDELKEVLEFVGENASATVKLDGEDAGSKATVTLSGQVIKVAFTEASVKADAGKSIEVNFKAKIRDNANLSAYVNKDGKTEIPNKASYDIDHNPKYHKDSNEVPVTPPTPEVPEIKKDVNGKEAETLDKRDEVFTYNVKTTVAQDATAFSVTDTLVDVLEFAGTSSAKLNGQALEANQIKVEGQTITLTLTEEQVKANGGQAVELTFDAKIKAGANLFAYVKEDGRTQIPNKASYDASFPHKPGVHKDSNEVPVTPPTPEVPEIKKDVNGKEAETLDKRDQVFTYNVKTSVAQDATAFSVTDTLVGVLEFAGTSSAKLNGQALEANQIKVEGQTITLTLTEEQVKANGGQAVELTFDAKIKAGANLSAYLSEDKTVKVPNKAAYKVDLPNKPGFTKDSNEVPVTPPTPEEPEIKKDVNGKEAETLDKRDQVFTYNVKTTVAQDATAFSVTDTLVDVLEFAGTSSAKLNGQALEASQIKVEGQTITLTLTEEQVKANGGQAVELTFDAKIKAGANLSAYLSEDKTVKVPNKAAYKADLPNKPGFTKDSNEVPVTPPTPEEPEIKKDVNGKEAETLDKRDQVFTYNVKTTVAQDATAFAVTDTLVDVLEFAGTSSAKLNGQALDASQIKVEGQTITLTLTEEQAKTSAGQAVELTFDAKIKAGANLSDYVTEDKSIKVPNKAAYKVDLPNKPGFTKDSNEVPVTPPTPEEPEIKKDVNTKAEETLADRDQVFTYNVKTSVPTDSTVFSVSDTLESVLDYAGSANASLNGQALEASQIKVDGQTITLTLTKEQVKANGGQAVELSFTAKIKAGADLTPYLTDRGFTVPNTASYDAKFPHKPGLHKDSNKVPVIVPKEPEPEISKKINRTLDHLDVEYDAPYMYNVNTTLPKDIDKYKEFTVTDTLEPVLAIADTPVAYVDGRDANGALETSVKGNTVTVKVKDFARLKGFKEIQLYIPAKLKANSDLKAYKDQLVPNKATVNFKDANGQSGSKETKPVTVKPRDPEKPTDPTPGEPAKTVGPEDGSKPDKDYHLPNALDTFRFDITTPVPTDPVDENGNAKKDQYGRLIKTDLTSFTITDKIDSVLKVNKDRIALKVENAQFDKIKATLQAQLEQSEKELKALTGKSTEETSTETGKKEELKAAEAKVAELKAKLEAAKAAQPAKPAETTTPATPATAAEETTPATSDSYASEDKKPATSEPSQDLASLEAELKAAEENLAKLQAPAEKESELAPADKKQQQEKLENEIKKLKEAQTKLQAAIDKLSKVSNDRGELVGKDLEAIATVTYDETSNVVTFEISDKDVLEALKGSTVRLVLYTNFKEGTDFTKFTGGVPNTAEVSFNHNPKPKTTNKVVVFPPTPPTPEKPQTPPPGGTVPPAEPKKTLPNTGSEGSSIFGVLAALALGLAGLLVWKRKAER
ncbi:LPXTG-anchored isopeptide-forming adhesin PadA [Streptococcus oralis subsp. oralis]|uniref:LPXTG-anchored isopeptide-forming adhesin PadA n=1 Tax=Streptococcus oralis TaxID=1303 RepID=UPI0001CC58F2|nr:LPXTG-anchored isopeptide-forming adhesin PadA [Streptococcus oralis]EFE57467.1 LPXTG-motif cell wall anchor domain protein [Streptococcus oralis ATCC 35037]OOR77599.1 cell surface protein [Streptococcus oralis]QQB71325.1 isopeptide-forming domain-containing fimbrial protein [Streptococcus oralis]VEF79592.1 LPXTG cell wall surface protein [Streptococcus oralis ATCC 35037]